MSDPECRLPDDTPAILRAAVAGDLAALQAALAADPAAIHLADPCGACAIHCVAANGCLPCLEALLAAGADPNTPMVARGPAPLEGAAPSEPAVTPLPEAGEASEADSQSSNLHQEDPMTALQWAAWGGHEGCLRALLAAGASLEPHSGGAGVFPPLHLAAIGDHEGCLRILLEAGAPLEARDSHADTPLMEACGWGHARCVTALLAAGADLEARGCDGTALQVAVAHGHGDCANVLLAIGARTVSPPAAAPRCCATPRRAF